MPKPDPHLVAMLETYLEAVKRGDITDGFVLFRCRDESYVYDYWTGDLPDMLYELGSTILAERSQGNVGRRN